MGLESGLLKKAGSHGKAKVVAERVSFPMGWVLLCFQVILVVRSFESHFWVEWIINVVKNHFW